MEPKTETFALLGDDEELKKIFAHMARKRHGLVPSSDPSAQHLRFAVYFGTDVKAAVDGELAHVDKAVGGFVFAGLVANEIVTGDPDASSLAFVFSGAGRAPDARHLSDSLANFGPSPTTGGLLSVLLAEEARADAEPSSEFSLSEAKLLVAAAALASCTDDVAKKRPGEQWQLFRWGFPVDRNVISIVVEYPDNLF
jgi:hypothetical protein